MRHINADPEVLAKYRAFKENSKCVTCPEKDPIVLEFHHRDPKTKSDAVSSLVHRGASWVIVLKEINKCDVLCSNCHKKVHAGVLKINCALQSR
jgi:hypothetical protein